MNRTSFLCLFSALGGLVGACARVVVDPVDLDGVNGRGGSAGATATTGGAGSGATDAGGTCNALPPPSPTLPNEPGCYVDMGAGWVSVPCLCEMWLENTTALPMTVSVQLTVTPPDQAPALTGTHDDEVDFEDPDASWYATWMKQTGNGEAFTVTTSGGTTTVRMGQSDVALAPVSLAACETRKAFARVVGSATLKMQGALDNTVAFAMTDGTCANAPPTVPH